MDAGTRFAGWRQAARTLRTGAGKGCRRWWRAGAAALVGLAGLAMVTLGPAGLAAAWQEHTERQQAQAHGAGHIGLGDEVRDGPVTFVVHEVRCGPHDDADHGRLCQLTLGARNDGTEEVTVSAGAQTLHVSEGARHQPTDPSAAWSQTLQPAASATTVIAYDLPVDATISHVEVRAGVHSHGVPVPVREPYPLVTPA